MLSPKGSENDSLASSEANSSKMLIESLRDLCIVAGELAVGKVELLVGLGAEEEVGMVVAGCVATEYEDLHVHERR